MDAIPSGGRLVDRLVTYTLELDGQLIIIEHVPARVDEETGERFFAPETVERLQEIAWGERTPSRTIQAPVFDFAA
jgi:YgiT-type zinc finger domain-containing protein